MSVEEDWDVDECRGDHEPDEHWELRKTFILKHKGSVDQQRLLCLAQVFVNVEFLGCRYPQETMERVQDLSLGIIEEYREKKKGRLQRTFVKASEAAEKKTKGSKRSSNTNEYPEIGNKVVIHGSSIPGSKITSVYYDRSSAVVFRQGESDASFLDALMKRERSRECITNTANILGSFGGMSVNQHNHSHSSSHEEERINTDLEFKITSSNESLSWETDETVVPKGHVLSPEAEAKLQGLVLYKSHQGNDSPISVLQNSCTKWKALSPVYEVEEISPDWFGCTLSICDEKIAYAEGRSQKTWKASVASKALKILQQYFYTINVKKPFHSLIEYGRKHLDKFGEASPLATESFNSAPLTEENRGIKLLKSMGWNGGGLGKNAQGIEKPIETPSVVEFSRSGIGLSTATNIAVANFAEKFKKFLEANMWQCFENDHDLQFSNEFDSNERKRMHEIASSMNLATKSYGKDEDRYMVVSKKMELNEIIEHVINAGGETDKYKLSLPGHLSPGNITDDDDES